MDTRILLSVLIGTPAVLFLGACSTISSRIAENPEAYARLSAHEQAAVSAGQIQRGMNRDAVYIAWGAPHEVREGSRSDGDFEQWSYYGYDYYTVPYGWRYPRPYGYYGRRCYGDSFLSYKLRYLDRMVLFRHGKVIAWEGIKR